MNTPIALGAAALMLSCAATANANVIAEFALHDHPDGNAAPPTYGLRIDGMLGAVTTFSFDVFNDVTLVVSDNGGNIEIDITGTLWGGEIVNNAYVDAKAYAIDFSYVVNVGTEANGWIVNGTNNVANTGTIIELDANLQPVTGGDNLVTLTDNDANSFLFLADGHRLANDVSSWVGRGWITTDTTGYNQGTVQDWLFTATEIPTPGAVALAGVAGLAAVRRRR